MVWQRSKELVMSDLGTSNKVTNFPLGFKQILLLVMVAIGIENVAWGMKTDEPLMSASNRGTDKFDMDSISTPKFVRIPPASVSLPAAFSMGNSLDQASLREVKVDKAFYMSDAEVTVAEFAAFVESGYTAAYAQTLEAGNEQHPVTNVSWTDARSYASWLGTIKGSTCRLPTESEWEYGARAGTTSSFAVPTPSGGESLAGPNKSLAHCADCNNKDGEFATAPVAVRSFEPNAWGLYDMHGNVSEWVEDCWHQDYAGAPHGTAEWTENCRHHAIRVTRGGSWNSLEAGASSFFRVPTTHFQTEEFSGFRVVCESN